MKPRTLLILAGLSLISGTGRAAGAAAEDGALFRPLSFESACQAASAEKKIVFIARNGSAEEALREYLWCYDVGMVQVASFVGARGSFLLSDIKQLGRAYPPALAALRDRRDEAERVMLNATGDRRAAMDFAALNGVLDENDRTLSVFDALPPGDVRRQGLLVRVFDLLVAAKRYNDAAEAVPLSQMRAQLERNLASLERMAATPRPTGQSDPFPEFVVRTTLKHVEVLAGSGQLEGARELARKVLEIDSSDATQRRLREALDRAGQPGLADDIAGKPEPAR